MKEKINKLLDPNISKKEEHEIFEEILKRKHDDDLKQKWQETLSTEYGIHKNSNTTNRKRSSKYIKIFLAAAACIAVILTLQRSNAGSNSSSELAQRYLNDQEILHPGASKGLAEENLNRTLAIQAFNSQKYQKSIEYFESLVETSEEDKYYNALAFLLNKEYQEAIQKFEETNKDSFRQEVNWYQSLAYLLNNQEENAAELLQQINKTDWNYAKSQKLLKTIHRKGSGL